MPNILNISKKFKFLIINFIHGLFRVRVRNVQNFSVNIFYNFLYLSDNKHN